MTAGANWRDDGACCGAHPDLFFPFGTTGAALRQIEEAKRICRVCPVQTQCLAWALENGVTDGVWGGTNPDERRVIRTLSRRKTFSEEDHTDESCQRQSTENKEYVRRLLKRRQPGFSAALELALVLAELELTATEMLGDFATADAVRVRVAALNRQQSVDLAELWSPSSEQHGQAAVQGRRGDADHAG
jgi:WhiB family redox-sensing transcriptional regulator